MLMFFLYNMFVGVLVLSLFLFFGDVIVGFFPIFPPVCSFTYFLFDQIVCGLVIHS